jgi:hypothetical protein
MMYGQKTIKPLNICNLLHMYDVFCRHNISNYIEQTGQVV